MGFLCERVRQKIEKHREYNNYTQWSDNIDDCQPAKSVSSQQQQPISPTECIYAFGPANAKSVQVALNAPPVHQHRNDHPKAKHRQQQQRNEAETMANTPANRASVKSRLHHQPPMPIGNGFIKRITQLISFNPGHRESTLSPTQSPTKTTLAATALVPDQSAATNTAATTTATASVSSVTTTTTTTTTTTSSTTTTVTYSHSQYLVRQSLCLYAASSFLLVLCYLATTAAAAEAAHPM